MTEHNERDPSLEALMPLDTHHGPALRNRPDRSAALVESALAEWATPVAVTRRSGWATLAMAASLLLGLGLAARALYVRVTDEPRRATAVSPQTAPLPAPPIPAVEAEAPEVDAVREEPSAAERRKDRERASEDWLKRGNRLRAEGRFRDAVAAYNHVVREDSGSSAYVARVAAASLKLEHLNDPRGAQALFLAAQRQFPRGSLDVEIERGLAEASRRLVGSRAP